MSFDNEIGNPMGKDEDFVVDLDALVVERYEDSP